MAPPSKHRGEFEVVVGVVGKPSAGKSTFFNAVTRATGAIAAKVAALPFRPSTRTCARAYAVLRADPALALGRPLSACPPPPPTPDEVQSLCVLLKGLRGAYGVCRGVDLCHTTRWSSVCENVISRGPTYSYYKSILGQVSL